MRLQPSWPGYWLAPVWFVVPVDHAMTLWPCCCAVLCAAGPSLGPLRLPSGSLTTCELQLCVAQEDTDGVREITVQASTRLVVTSPGAWSVPGFHFCALLQRARAGVCAVLAAAGHGLARAVFAARMVGRQARVLTVREVWKSCGQPWDATMVLLMFAWSAIVVGARARIEEFACLSTLASSLCAAAYLLVHSAASPAARCTSSITLPQSLIAPCLAKMRDCGCCMVGVWNANGLMVNVMHVFVPYSLRFAHP